MAEAVRLGISRKGFTAPVEEMIQWVGLIVICMVMLIVIINWSSAGSRAQQGIEQASLMYTIASSANALSTVEEGEVTRNLRSYYDIEIDCSGVCKVKTTPYDTNNELQKESNEVLILGRTLPAKLQRVNRITISRPEGEAVRLSGEWVEDLFGTDISIKEYGSMCFSTEARFKEEIEQASQRYGVEKELIASVIIAESSWNPDTYRYEPGYQARYLEGGKWFSDSAWLRSGPTINEWFAVNPERNKERSGLSSEQLGLTAQTRVSASYGLMQTLYTTAAEACGYKGSPEGLKDPNKSIECGTRYLKSRLDLYNDITDAVSAYNGGSSIWRQNIANRQYTEKVLGLYRAFNTCGA